MPLGPNTLPPPSGDSQTIEGMRVLITALVHQLGGSAVVEKVELDRVYLENKGIDVYEDDSHRFTIREVDQ